VKTYSQLPSDCLPIAFRFLAVPFVFLQVSGHWAWNDAWTSGKGKVIKARLPGKYAANYGAVPEWWRN